MSIRKHDILKAQAPVSANAGEYPPGVVFVCLRGGKEPQLAYINGAGSARLITVNLAWIDDKLASGVLLPVGRGDVPPELSDVLISRGHWKATQANAPTVKKGDLVETLEPVAFPDGSTLPANTVLRAEKGGRVPLYLNYQNGILYRVKIGRTKTRPSKGVDTKLPPITVNIKVFEEMSEETLAIRGTLTLGGKVCHVRNDGHGGPNMYSGEGETPLRAAIDECLTNAGMVLKAHKFEDTLDNFVDFAGEYMGLVSFPEYVTMRRVEFAQFCAQHDDTSGE